MSQTYTEILYTMSKSQIYECELWESTCMRKKKKLAGNLISIQRINPASSFYHNTMVYHVSNIASIMLQCKICLM